MDLKTIKNTARWTSLIYSLRDKKTLDLNENEVHRK